MYPPAEPSRFPALRPDVQAMHASAGQPSAGLVKLDAMENPFRLPPALQRDQLQVWYARQQSRDLIFACRHRLAGPAQPQFAQSMTTLVQPNAMRERVREPLDTHHVMQELA